LFGGGLQIDVPGMIVVHESPRFEERDIIMPHPLTGRSWAAENFAKCLGAGPRRTLD